MSCRCTNTFLLLGLFLASSAQAAEGLTLGDALNKALQQNPTLQAAGQQTEAARGRQQQAGVLPNPEVGVLLEDFSGDTGVSAGEATTTMELSQRLELGGKRSSRVAIARTDTREAELALQVRRPAATALITLHTRLPSTCGKPSLQMAETLKMAA